MNIQFIKIFKDKFNRKELVNRLNHTNSKLKGLGSISSDESQDNLLKTLLNTTPFRTLHHLAFSPHLNEAK